MPTVKISPETIAALQPHAGWDDGREGFEWCRFDARLTTDEKNLRAEVTWNDDTGLQDGNDTPTYYFDPQVTLETNRLVGTDLKTVDAVHFGVTHEEAVAIIQADPKELLTKYADKIAKLEPPLPLEEQAPSYSPKERLEELRATLREESMSYDELHELQSLAEHIEPGDVELLEPAGVPEALAHVPKEVRRAVLKSKPVCVVTVTDPDTQQPVEVEIRKLETGGMVGIDGSYLDQDVGPVMSPYDSGVEVEIPDDEVVAAATARPREPSRFVLLRDVDGDKSYFHGCFRIPEELSEACALQVVTEVHRDVVAADPEEWGYAAVSAELERRGFRPVRLSIWTE